MNAEMEITSIAETFTNYTSDILVNPEPTTTEPEILDSELPNADSDETDETSPEDEEKYELRDCLVELERCDKIWKTIQLIRDLQDTTLDTGDCSLGMANGIVIDNANADEVEPESMIEIENGQETEEDNGNDNFNDNFNDHFNDNSNDKEENSEEQSISSANDDASNLSSTTNTTAPYIKYQPVLDNGNTALPNFIFSVQRTRVLYPCLQCGKQYSHSRSLKEHSERVHNIIMPPSRKKTEVENKVNPIKTEVNTDVEMETESEPVIESKDDVAVEEKTPEVEKKVEEPPVMPTYDFAKTFDSKTQRFACPFCDKSYKDKYTLTKHVKALHGKFVNISSRTYNREQAMATKRANAAKRLAAQKIAAKRNAAKKSAAATAAAATAAKETTEVPEDPSAPETFSLINNQSTKPRRVKKSSCLDVYRCKICGKHFYNKRYFRGHSRKVHGIYVRKNPTLPAKSSQSEKSSKSKNRPVKTETKNQPVKSETKNQIQTTLTVKRNSLTLDTRKKKTVELQNLTMQQCHSSKFIRKCPVCNKPYRDFYSWKRHCQKEHNLMVKFVRFFKTELANDNYNCKLCDQKFDKLRETSLHYRMVHRRRLRYSCESCTSMFQKIDGLIKHSSSVHNVFLVLRKVSKGDRICKLCGIRFTDRADLQEHVKEEHGGKSPSSEKKAAPIKKKPAPTVQKKVRKKFVMPTRRKSLREKPEVSYNLDNKLSIEKMISNNSFSVKVEPERKSPKKQPEASPKRLKSGEILPADNLTNVTYTCILCENRRLKDIRKHFMVFHKVRNPEPLIAQCSVEPAIETSSSSSSSVEHRNNSIVDDKSKINIKSESVINEDKQQMNSGKFPGKERFFVRISATGEPKLYACKYCPFMSNNYDAMRTDENKHKREGITADTKPLNDYVNNYDNKEMVTINKELVTINKKRKRDSTDSRESRPETRRRRLSTPLTAEQIRTTRASTKFKEEYYHICSICNRTFRTYDILKSHKISCKSRPDQVPTGIETSDTRASSDRDSGIGISITIKKKNDSYEIVNRDNGEEKSNELPNTPQQNNNDNDNNDATLFDCHPQNDVITPVNTPIITLSEKADNFLEYSLNHEFVKLQQAEDFDVDIVSDTEAQNTSDDLSNNQVVVQSENVEQLNNACVNE